MLKTTLLMAFGSEDFNPSVFFWILYLIATADLAAPFNSKYFDVIVCHTVCC